MRLPIAADLLAVGSDQHRRHIESGRGPLHDRRGDEAAILRRDGRRLPDRFDAVWSASAAASLAVRMHSERTRIPAARYLRAQLRGVIDHVQHVATAVSPDMHLHGSDLGHRFRRYQWLVGDPEHRRLLIRHRHDAVGFRPPVGDLVVGGIDRLVGGGIEIDIAIAMPWVS